MNAQQPILLSAEACSQVSGGHDSTITALFILEIPHMFMGCVELGKYLAERYENGCEDIEKGDVVTRALCSTYRALKSPFSS